MGRTCSCKSAERLHPEICARPIQGLTLSLQASGATEHRPRGAAPNRRPARGPHERETTEPRTRRAPNARPVRRPHGRGALRRAWRRAGGAHAVRPPRGGYKVHIVGSRVKCAFCRHDPAVRMLAVPVSGLSRTRPSPGRAPSRGHTPQNLTRYATFGHNGSKPGRRA
jgi:hypothetical protein